MKVCTKLPIIKMNPTYPIDNVFAAAPKNIAIIPMQNPTNATK